MEFGLKSVHQPEYAQILSKLIEARKAAGLTQQELASMLSKPQSYVSKLERGERRIDVLEFLELCGLLHLEPSSFVKSGEDT